MFNEDHMIIDMLAAGAIGYLLKDASKKDIIKAIYTVYKKPASLLPVNKHQTGKADRYEHLRSGSKGKGSALSFFKNQIKQSCWPCILCCALWPF